MILYIIITCNVLGMLLENMIVQSMCHSIAKGNLVAVMIVRNCLFLNSVLFNTSASTITMY